MRKRRLKKELIPYLLGITSIIVVSIGIIVGSNIEFEQKDDYDYVSETILDETTPVVSETVVVLKPFTDNEVKILTNYYDYNASNEQQEESLIYNEGTYMQNTGVIYGKEATFDVISILDGTVKDVKNDPMLGTVVEIEHENNVISIYQSLSETTLKKGDAVLRGQVIGTSGTCNLNSSLGNHLLFELIVNGSNVNPEEYYGKPVNEL